MEDIRAAATGNALSPTVNRRVRRTSRDVDEVERSRRLASVSAGRHKHKHKHTKSSFSRLSSSAFFDKSTKFGTKVDQYIMNKSGYAAIGQLTPGGRGSHFAASR